MCETVYVCRAINFVPFGKLTFENLMFYWVSNQMMDSEQQALLDRLASLRIHQQVLQKNISTLQRQQLERHRQRLDTIGDRERHRAAVWIPLKLLSTGLGTEQDRAVRATMDKTE